MNIDAKLVAPAVRPLFPWPLPALAAWLCAWFSNGGAIRFGAPLWFAFVCACIAAAVWARSVITPWRRTFLLAGFPLSWLMLGLVSVQGPIMSLWWLVPLALLLSLYPAHSWSDAPLFPTPANALKGLSGVAPLAPRSPILDAGCGLGAGLRALAAEYPQASLSGWDWSRPLVWMTRWRMRSARIRRADIWKEDWSAFEMVYLFQRPESMARAVSKARSELPSGAYLVSLEFEAPGLSPLAKLETVPGKPLWVYRAPFTSDQASS